MTRNRTLGQSFSARRMLVLTNTAGLWCFDAKGHQIYEDDEIPNWDVKSVDSFMFVFFSYSGERNGSVCWCWDFKAGTRTRTNTQAHTCYPWSLQHTGTVRFRGHIFLCCGRHTHQHSSVQTFPLDIAPCKRDPTKAQWGGRNELKCIIKKTGAKCATFTVTQYY